MLIMSQQSTDIQSYRTIGLIRLTSPLYMLSILEIRCRSKLDLLKYRMDFSLYQYSKFNFFINYSNEEITVNGCCCHCNSFELYHFFNVEITHFQDLIILYRHNIRRTKMNFVQNIQISFVTFDARTGLAVSSSLKVELPKLTSNNLTSISL